MFEFMSLTFLFNNLGAIKAVLNVSQLTCRSISKDIESKHAAELEEKERELALRVADATLNQVKAKLESDIEVLKSLVPTAEKEAQEAGKDLKYLKERQMSLNC